MNLSEIFSELVEGNGSEYVMRHRGKWVIDTKHSLDRINDRGAYGLAMDYFKKAVDWLLDNGKSGKKYMIVSRSLWLGAVIHWRADGKNKNDGDQAVVVTWLGDIRNLKIKDKTPEGVFSTSGTDKVIIEAVAAELGLPVGTEGVLID